MPLFGETNLRVSHVKTRLGEAKPWTNRRFWPSPLPSSTCGASPTLELLNPQGGVLQLFCLRQTPSTTTSTSFFLFTPFSLLSFSTNQQRPLPFLLRHSFDTLFSAAPSARFSKNTSSNCDLHASISRSNSLVN